MKERLPLAALAFSNCSRTICPWATPVARGFLQSGGKLFAKTHSNRVPHMAKCNYQVSSGQGVATFLLFGEDRGVPSSVRDRTYENPMDQITRKRLCRLL